ncbi:MAG: hypothetical protein JO323_20760 [Acidobacteriia bacterium]|nr:hypothetical protein [Terriglobia bacterium]
MNPRAFCICIALLSATSQAGANDSSLDRSTLRGLSAFSLAVDTPDQELQDRGLTSAAIQTELEQKLLKAGISIDKSANEFLGVRITAAHAKRGDFAVSITLSVYQGVSLRRDPTIVSATPTWSAESVLLVPPRQLNDAWTDTVDQLADQFITAWRAANPSPKSKDPVP